MKFYNFEIIIKLFAMQDGQSISQEIPNHILPQNSVHSIPQSTIFTQSQQRKAQNKKNTKIKHKKSICMLLVAIFALAYYIAVKTLKEPEKVKQQVKFEEAEIQFDTNLGQKTAWIKQKLDHFNKTQNGAWKQRLVLDIDLSTITSDTPIFLNIPPLTSAKYSNNYKNIQEINKNIKGAIICIQPRYFGQSKPFGDNSFLTQNLKYLTIEQIIEDVAYTIKRIIIKKYFNITKKNPWILTGDSYSGMIVVWLRAKYPQLTVGAYVSSPIIPTALVPQISQRLYSNMVSGGKKCKSIFFRIINEFKQKAYGPKGDGLLLDIARGLQITAEQAMQMIMDKLRTFQRYQFINMCVGGSEESILQNMVNFLYYTDHQGIDPIAYSRTELISSQSWQQFEAVKKKRAFEWLRCNQIGLFQVNSENKKSLNFKELNQNYFKNRCKRLFGQDLWPNPQALIDKLAFSIDSIKNLIIVNGAHDIWLPYCFIGKNTSTVTSFTTKCSSCEHNFDITKEQIVLTELDDLREKQKAIIGNWTLQSLKN